MLVKKQLHLAHAKANAALHCWILSVQYEMFCLYTLNVYHLPYNGHLHTHPVPFRVWLSKYYGRRMVKPYLSHDCWLYGRTCDLSDSMVCSPIKQWSKWKCLVHNGKNHSQSPKNFDRTPTLDQTTGACSLQVSGWCAYVWEQWRDTVSFVTLGHGKIEAVLSNGLSSNLCCTFKMKEFSRKWGL